MADNGDLQAGGQGFESPKLHQAKHLDPDHGPGARAIGPFSPALRPSRRLAGMSSLPQARDASTEQANSGQSWSA